MNLIVAGVLAGVAMAAVGGAFHLLTPRLFPSVQSAYTNTDLFRPWEGGTREYMAVHPFLFGFVFVIVYTLLRQSGLADARLVGGWGGAAYGLGVFTVGTLPIYALTLAAFRVAPEVIILWTIQNLAQYVVAGAIIGIWFASADGNRPG